MHRVAFDEMSPIAPTKTPWNVRHPYGKNSRAYRALRRRVVAIRSEEHVLLLALVAAGVPLALDANSDPWKTIPDQWRGKLASQLASGEELIASFEFDLDGRLHYVTGMVALTNRRILATNFENAGLPQQQTPHSVVETNGSSTLWQNWTIADGMELSTAESGGVGTLELCDSNRRLAYWRYTAARSAKASSFEAYWTTLQSRGECRGRRFAADGLSQLRRSDHQRRSHLRRLCCQAATAAGVVVVSSAGVCQAAAFDDSPQFGADVGGRNGGVSAAVSHDAAVEQRVRSAVRGQTCRAIGVLLPGRTVGASLAACLLGWARLYISARVSEQITSDLRLRTYSHLQQLSVEFFGGKRTGDLMSRISNDTERICNFLSINLVDFVNDSLMIVMTSVILLSINPGWRAGCRCRFRSSCGWCMRSAGRCATATASRASPGGN